MIRRLWAWLNTPNELRWGEGLEWHPKAPKPTLGAAIVRLLDHP